VSASYHFITTAADAKSAYDAGVDATEVLRRHGLPDIDARMLAIAPEEECEVGLGATTSWVWRHDDGQPSVLAIPIVDGGRTVDLILFNGGNLDDWHLLLGNAAWAGIDAIRAGGSVRVHATPQDWLRDGCTGACFVERGPSMAAMTIIQEEVDIVLCRDPETAFRIWQHAFDEADEALDRIELDAPDSAVAEHLSRAARYAAIAARSAA